MDLGDTGKLLEEILHCAWIDPARDGVEHEIDRIPEQSPGPDQNDRDDDQAADRIDQRPTRFENDETGYDHAG